MSAMRSTTLLAGALVLAMAGCSKEPRRVPTAVTTCAQAGQAFAEVLAIGLAKQKHPGDKVARVRARVDAEVAATCARDAWEAATFACLSKVETVEDLNPCKIPQSSEAHLNQQMKTIVNEEMAR